MWGLLETILNRDVRLAQIKIGPNMSMSQNVLKLICPRFVSFGVHLNNLGQLDIPASEEGALLTLRKIAI